MPQAHVAVIGGGLGGLSAGALLAKRGYKVTLLEQHRIVGGCATVFKRKGGFRCEVGLHEMDGLYTDPFKRELFEELGVYDALTFIEPKEFFSVRLDDEEFIMPARLHSARQALSARFRSEAEAIGRYFETIEAISREYAAMRHASRSDKLLFPWRFKRLWRYRHATLKEVFDALFADERLKLLLNANMGYYHDTPDRFSFIYHAVAQYSYFEGGGWFIKGGSQMLSDYLAQQIVAHGGEVITSARVTSMDDKHLVYERKRTSHDLAYDIAISNLAPHETYRLYGEEIAPPYEAGTSLFCLYLGFSQNLKERFGKQAYSRFFFEGMRSLDDQARMPAFALEKRGFVFVDYSQIDSALAPEGKSFGVIVTTDRIEAWEGLDKDKYNAKKEAVAQHFIARLQEAYGGIDKLIEYQEAATPKTIRRYILTPQGTPYGYAPTPKRIFTFPQVRSKRYGNLYFVGQWVIGGGFSPALQSGLMAANAIEKQKGHDA